MLRDLWTRTGESASTIATMMGIASRNSILGKAHRMGLPSRKQRPTKARLHNVSVPKPTSRRGKSGSIAKKLNAKAWSWKVEPVIIPGDTRRLKSEAWNALPGVLPVSLADLDKGMCKWPIGEGRPYLFCGAAAAGVYCAEHYLMSIGKGTDSERDAVRQAMKEAA